MAEKAMPEHLACWLDYILKGWLSIIGCRRCEWHSLQRIRAGLLQENSHLFKWEWAAVEVALNFVTGVLSQKDVLLTTFHALGYHAHVEIMGHINNCYGNVCPIRISGNIAHK